MTFPSPRRCMLSQGTGFLSPQRFLFHRTPPPWAPARVYVLGVRAAPLLNCAHIPGLSVYLTVPSAGFGSSSAPSIPKATSSTKSFKSLRSYGLALSCSLAYLDRRSVNGAPAEIGSREQHTGSRGRSYERIPSIPSW